MKKERRDGKIRVLLCSLIVLGIFAGIILFSYACYIVELLSPAVAPYDSLVGSLYGSLGENTYLQINEENLIVSDSASEKGFYEYDYTDGILRLSETVTFVQDGQEVKDEITYTFVFLEGDQLFYAEKNMYLELLWKRNEESFE